MLSRFFRELNTAEVLGFTLQSRSAALTNAQMHWVGRPMREVTGTILSANFLSVESQRLLHFEHESHFQLTGVAQTRPVKDYEHFGTELGPNRTLERPEQKLFRRLRWTGYTQKIGLFLFRLSTFRTNDNKRQVIWCLVGFFYKTILRSLLCEESVCPNNLLGKGRRTNNHEFESNCWSWSILNSIFIVNNLTHPKSRLWIVTWTKLTEEQGSSWK